MSHQNRLSNEKSPYLLQHSENPVDWYPWGEEAFAKARDEGKAIFLSIGYATCHWCHVMERESFENEAIAEVMNRHFINVKVDREERPDVDQIYMAAVQRISGQGGWPMSVFLTPDLHPFYAGTYFPPESRYGRPGFPDLLERLAELFVEQREEIEGEAQKLTALLAEASAKIEAKTSFKNRIAIAGAKQELAAGFDEEWGGFGRAPKFPRSMALMLLAREQAAGRDPSGEAQTMVEKTLEMMRRGGIHDHVGGGFARYSVDAEWLVPHFEKMLYDNALLAMSYLEAWQASGDDDHARCVRGILDWTLREMTHEGGAFYSAMDADSEGVEGKFYVWTPDEVEAAVGKDDAVFLGALFDLRPEGNFEGKTVFALRRTLEDTATELGIAKEDVIRRWETIQPKLYAKRAERVWPITDDKILSSWNGLMIAAMAKAGALLEEPRYVEAAKGAADFIWRELRKDGALLRRWRDGESVLNGTIEDYAFMAWGELDLFLATGRPEDLERCTNLIENAIERFHDQERGAFFMADEGEPHLVVRTKDAYDGATPSGNSAISLVLARFAALTGESKWQDIAERSVAAFAEEITRHPSAYPLLLCALDQTLTPTAQEVFVRGLGDEDQEFARRWRKPLAPGTIKLEIDEDQLAQVTARLPWVEGKKRAEGRATLWRCRDFVCERPLNANDDIS